MKPFLRPADRGPLAPVGWESEPAGVWAGRAFDVVYDPTRHRVLVVHGDMDPGAAEQLRADGWQRQVWTARNALWVRDDLAHDAPARLDRHRRTPGPPVIDPPDLGGIA